MVRGAAPDAAAQVEPLKLTTAQQKAQSRWRLWRRWRWPSSELCVEDAVSAGQAARTSEEDARLKSLNASIEQEIAEMQSIFSRRASTRIWSRRPSAGNEHASSPEDADAQSYLQNTLAKLGPRVMGIRLLLGEDHAYAIVVTATARKKFELGATPAELRSQSLRGAESSAVARLRSPAATDAVICNGRGSLGR